MSARVAAHMSLHMSVHTSTHMSMHMSTRTHVRARAHTHVCTHVHTHAAAWPLAPRGCCFFVATPLGPYSLPKPLAITKMALRRTAAGHRRRRGAARTYVVMAYAVMAYAAMACMPAGRRELSDYRRRRRHRRRRARPGGSDSIFGDFRGMPTTNAEG